MFTLDLPEEDERRVNELIASGRYESVSDLMTKGLRALDILAHENELKLAALREKVEVGIAQVRAGKVSPLDMEEIKREGRRRLATKQRKARCEQE